MNRFFDILKIGWIISLTAFATVDSAPLRAQVAPAAAGAKKSKSADFEDYDIRLDGGDTAQAAKASFRTTAKRTANSTGTERTRRVAAEARLRQRIPGLKIETNPIMGVPEVIGLSGGPSSSGAGLAARSVLRSNADTLRQFLSENTDLVGMKASQIGDLKMVADYTNPDGNLSYSHLEQSIQGVPVFQGEIKAAYNRRGEMFRVINNLAPELDATAPPANFGDPAQSVANSFQFVPSQLHPIKPALNAAKSTDLKAVFGEGDRQTTAEKMFFPTEAGTVRAAWRVLVWQPLRAYYVIVDAETGALLWRKNISNDQSQPATYNVYANATNLLNVANNPAPVVPALTTPNSSTQGPLIARTNVTLVGNEPPNTFNNLGWITDGANLGNGFTEGNNVRAGLDIDGTDGIDATVSGTNRVFNFTYNPPPGSPTPGDAPSVAAFRNGAVTQLFYTVNRYHDAMYRLGFTEAARNFQNVNFTGAGLGNDRISAEAQDSSGTGNANFQTPADGSPPRMQLYLFTGPNPDRDSDLDNETVVHELTHGLSNRLVGNGAGLNGNRASSMGEGWSDFYSLALLSDPATSLAANYSTAGYSAYLLTPNYTYNNYYGIRRFPYAIRSFTGGPNNLPHNPLTFADIDPAQMNLSDGAFPVNPTYASSDATEPHNAGEVWCSALWEVRALLITRLGAAAGNLKSLQLVTDGLKMTPNRPNFIQARDAIIAAAQASSAADAADVREGFRIRGMGFDAQDNLTSVVESFAFPNVRLTDPFSVSDSIGDNDGYPEPGETILLNLTITNTTDATINSVAVNVNGGNNFAYGNIASGATVPMQIPYRIPAGAVCGSLHTVTLNLSSAVGTVAPQTRSFMLGVPNFASSMQNFDGVTAPSLPAFWTQTSSGANTGWITTTTNAVSGPNAVFAPDPSATGTATLETMASITSASAQLSFNNRFSTESGYDGTVLEIRIGNGVYQDILAAGGSFVSGGYSRALSSSTSLGARQAWTGANGTGATTVVNLPAAANGQTIGLRWITVSDTSTSGAGTWYDDMQLSGGNFLTGYACSIPPTKLIVTKTADTNDGVCDGDCSLREALSVAGTDDAVNIITFNIPATDPGASGNNATITLASPLVPTSDGSIRTTIDGTGVNNVTLSGNNATQILRVNSGVVLSINALNFTRGSIGTTGSTGGAIFVAQNGALTLSNAAVFANSAPNGGGIATENGSMLTLTNVTISGNSASQFGGGLYLTGSTTANSCTITNNSAQFVGGVFFSGGSMSIGNTIIANNSATSTFSNTPDANGNFTSQGYNLVGNSAGANGFSATGDQTGVNAKLASLTNNGGPTRTHALQIGSAAIDTGNSSLSTDQRGLARVSGVRSEKGAYELQPETYDFWASYVFPSGTLAASTAYTADPDGDGTPNWLEQFTGHNPLSADTPAAVVDLNIQGTNLVLRYARSITADPVKVFGEQSLDLQTWTKSGITYQNLGASGSTTTELIQALIPFNSAPKKFGRLHYIP